MIQTIKDLVSAKADTTVALAKEIWGYAELSYEETKSAAALIAALKQEGFTIEEGIADIPTAFTATYQCGSGKPVVGFLAEYDALSGLSQKAGCPVQEPVQEGGAGHGCGHNLLGAGCYAAAVALKDYLVKEQKDGTVIFFGCPAEEGAGSKQFIARAGYFDNVDFAYTWHPETVNEVGSRGSVAIMGANFTFDGIAAHAGGEPHLGRSALDAVELMNVGCNYLREHMIDAARIHYAYSDPGGTAPNVVQSHAVIKYEVRAPKVSQVQELFTRVVDVAKGAALMTGTKMKYEITMAFSDYVPNRTLGAVVDQCMREMGAPEWTEDEYQLAAEFLRTYPRTTMVGIREKLGYYFEPEELDAFCKLFGELDAPLGKYYVLGNHDLFHHWREPSFGRADLERGFAAAGVRILEDTSVLLPCGVRVVGRKDYLYTNGSRFTAAQLMPGGPDDHYTVWLDHEPRDFKNAAAAGADLILSGHTHGGQVWPAGAVGMVAKNERNYGRKNIADHCDAIVSGGTGTWGYKFRTQGRTEIVCAEITTEREN